MAEHLRIDSQKMVLHPEWVSRWQKARNNWKETKSIYPIQVEISPAGACNHRCTFCAPDFVGYRPNVLSKSILENSLKDMYLGGVKSVMFGGEGEPVMHSELADIIVSARKMGIDVALTTNGSLMNEKFLKKALNSITWIKVSIDAGKKDTYQKIHRPKNLNDWERVFENLKFAVKFKKNKSLNCRIGVQMLLLPGSVNENGEKIPGNEKEVFILAEKLKKIGVNYFIIKPYSYQPLSLTKAYKNIVYKDFEHIEEALKKISDNNFEIIFRSISMRKNSADRNYKRCLAIPFAWAYIMADGSVYSCSAYLLDKRFYLGNINEKSFREIWEGEERKKQWEFMKNFNPENCRKNCIMDKVNDYLWEVANPPYNVNFI